MKTAAAVLYAISYCLCAATIGGIVGAVAGTGIAGMLMRPEEAVILTTGVSLGGPVGVLIGLILAVIALSRRADREE